MGKLKVTSFEVFMGQQVAVKAPGEAGTDSYYVFSTCHLTESPVK